MPLIPGVAPFPSRFFSVGRPRPIAQGNWRPRKRRPLGTRLSRIMFQFPAMPPPRRNEFGGHRHPDAGRERERIGNIRHFDRDCYRMRIWPIDACATVSKRDSFPAASSATGSRKEYLDSPPNLDPPGLRRSGLSPCLGLSWGSFDHFPARFALFGGSSFRSACRRRIALA